MVKESGAQAGGHQADVLGVSTPQGGAYHPTAILGVPLPQIHHSTGVSAKI